jgi:hypothetical protein
VSYVVGYVVIAIKRRAKMKSSFSTPPKGNSAGGDISLLKTLQRRQDGSSESAEKPQRRGSSSWQRATLALAGNGGGAWRNYPECGRRAIMKSI